MNKYRVNAYPTFLTQYNIFQVQKKVFIFWKTIADFRNIDDAISFKAKMENI